MNEDCFLPHSNGHLGLGLISDHPFPPGPCEAELAFPAQLCTSFLGFWNLCNDSPVALLAMFLRPLLYVYLCVGGQACVHSVEAEDNLRYYP